VHLIAEGSVKLIAHTNPFSNPEINTTATAEGETANYETNTKVSNNKSGG